MLSNVDSAIGNSSFAEIVKDSVTTLIMMGG